MEKAINSQEETGMKDRMDYNAELKDDTPLPAEMEIRHVKGTKQKEDDDIELKDDTPLPADMEIREED